MKVKLSIVAISPAYSLGFIELRIGIFVRGEGWNLCSIHLTLHPSLPLIVTSWLTVLPSLSPSLPDSLLIPSACYLHSHFYLSFPLPPHFAFYLFFFFFLQPVPPSLLPPTPLLSELFQVLWRRGGLGRERGANLICHHLFRPNFAERRTHPVRAQWRWIDLNTTQGNKQHWGRSRMYVVGRKTFLCISE